jgi:hypothetical protein
VIVYVCVCVCVCVSQVNHIGGLKGILLEWSTKATFLQQQQKTLSKYDVIFHVPWEVQYTVPRIQTYR